MKKPSNRGNGHAIIATLEDPDLLQILVERLAECNVEIGYCKQQVQPGWKAIDTSSIEVLASVGLHFPNEKDTNTSSVTSFLFTCIKTIEGKYDLTWSYSLS